MFRAMETARGMIRKSIRRDRGFQNRTEAMSWWLWPWRESRLMGFVGLLAILDYGSTYAFLRLGGNSDVYESGLMASWALQRNGFVGLLLADLLAVAAILTVAWSARFAYTKMGFKGFGRAAFVVMLMPYVLITTGVIFNNMVLAFR